MNYYFKFVFTKSNAGAAPSPAPTVTISDLISNTTLISGAALTALSGQTGVYFYIYSGAADLNLIGKAVTTDTSVDEKEQYYEASFSVISTSTALAALQANVTTILADYARRTGDYSTLTAALVWAALVSGLTTSGSIGKLLADNIDAKISDAIQTGSGSVSKSITVTDGLNPIDGVDVWITTDSAGANAIARGYTNDLGVVTFLLDPGTYYVWKQLAGYTFTNPTAITVTA